MADQGLVWVDFGLVGDVSAVTTSVDLHFILRKLESSCTNTGDNPHLAIGGVIGSVRRPPRPLQQGGVLRFCPLLAGAPAHHVNVEELGKMRYVMLGHGVLDNKD